ncbi:hypothetical protein F5X68DRAFT_227173 [Plectosphaerella plurivora]|uniref:Nephrocystin 3-like N-terminal domain-containing protein n=1 Tax=Plectosphaerella plurivora TaxID=936078 RepID=A0A9P8VM23_9PEZI|nr:hypothetical protein F5X68DRAFT_227173 [Plectosphaerella plurivora]
MEIVGVVAAVPALLKMIQVANSSLGPIASKTRTSKLAQGIRTHSISSPKYSQALKDGELALAQEPNDRVLVIHGIKGSGKSVLAASVVEGLREKKATTLFFSFWASHGRERRIEAMFRALLLQFLESLPEDTQSKLISRLLDNQKELKDPKFLVEQLCAIAQEDATDVFCVLDGIDESADDWNSVDNESPLVYLGNLISAIPKLRLLLVGRQSSLRSAIQRWPIQLELTRELVLDDLQLFISSELTNCTNISNDDMRETVRMELDAKSTVMFLWIKLVFSGLRHSFTLNEVKFTLGRIPEELDREYSRLLLMLMARLQGHSEDPSAGMIRARGLLEIIVGASRPLSFVELRLAYAFTFASDDSASGYLDNLVTEEGIIDG